MWERAIERRDAEVRRRPSPREDVVHDDGEPIPAPNEVRWDRLPPNSRLVRGEVGRGREENGEWRAVRTVADKGGGSLKDRCKSPATGSVEKEPEEEPLEEG